MKKKPYLQIEGLGRGFRHHSTNQIIQRSRFTVEKRWNARTGSSEIRTVSALD